MISLGKLISRYSSIANSWTSPWVCMLPCSVLRFISFTNRIWSSSFFWISAFFIRASSRTFSASSITLFFIINSSVSLSRSSFSSRWRTSSRALSSAALSACSRIIFSRSSNRFFISWSTRSSRSFNCCSRSSTSNARSSSSFNREAFAFRSCS